ncbi:MAG: PhaM family polyhydroxyalkanoate granule multifunctional regulatory protein [Burkholderiales bacterium]
MADDKHKPQSDPQGGSKLPFTPQDALEFMQRMWNPLGIPIPGFAPPAAAAPGAAQGSVPFPMPAAMFAALDPAEIDRKIAELRIVENWLAMSLSMMQMSIKTMELQKASIEAMRGGGSPSR